MIGFNFPGRDRLSREAGFSELNAASSFPSMNPLIQIADEVRATLAGPLRLRSIVLTGSLARDEGTWSWRRGRARLIGDAEFLVVFEGGASLPSSEGFLELKREIETRLRANAIDTEIGLSPVRPAYLSSLRPHIFAYELLQHGKVIWGDTQILDRVPRFSPSDIPLEDGFRLLANRLIELLEVVCEAKEIEPLTSASRYRGAKLWLDMATSFLLFQRQYESTYRKRATILAIMASTTVAAPIPLRRFAKQVCLATKYKLGESQRSPIDTAEDLLALIEDVHSLWNWELEHLTGANSGASDNELLSRWLCEQGAIERLRGWTSLAKRHGILASIRDLPRWVKVASKGSPRRLIYAAASELFFALPTLLSGDKKLDGAQGWSQPRWKLPVMNESEDAYCWRRFADAIARNYHHFLESTTS